MREFVEVNLDARLIQENALGFCHATEPLERKPWLVAA